MIPPKLPDSIEIPPHFDRAVLLRLALGFSNGPPNRPEIEASPQDNPSSQRYFRIGDPLLRQPLHHVPGDRGIILRPTQTLGNELEARQKSREIRERPYSIYGFPLQTG